MPALVLACLFSGITFFLDDAVGGFGGADDLALGASGLAREVNPLRLFNT